MTTSRKIPQQVWNRWVPALGIACVMIYYASLLYRHALSIPITDDIFDVLQFLSKVLQSTHYSHALEAFFAHTNDHRTLASRLIYYLAYRAEGEVHFRTLIFLANLALPLLLLMLYLPIRRHPHALLMLLPAALVLFQLRFYTLSFWSMAAFAYLFVYVYAFAAITCLRNVNVIRFIAALVFATLGTFTLASGQLIWLVGLASLLHQALILRRTSLWYALCWMVYALALLLVWRIDYVSPNSMAFITHDVIARPLYHLAYFLTLLGAAVTESSVVLAACAGTTLLLVAAYFLIRNISREDISLELFTAFIVSTIFVMMIGRASISPGLEYALTSRYSFPSVLLLATLTVLLVFRLGPHGQQLKVSAGAIFLAFAYWVFSFQTYPAALQGQLERRVAFYNQGNFGYWGRSSQETQAIVNESVALGIYTLPPRPQPKPAVVP